MAKRRRTGFRRPSFGGRHRGITRKQRPEFATPKYKYNAPLQVRDWRYRISKGNFRWSFFIRDRSRQQYRFRVWTPEQIRRYRSFWRLWQRSLPLVPIPTGFDDSGNPRRWEFISGGSPDGKWVVTAEPRDGSILCDWITEPGSECYVYVRADREAAWETYEGPCPISHTTDPTIIYNTRITWTDPDDMMTREELFLRTEDPAQQLTFTVEGGSGATPQLGWWSFDSPSSGIIEDYSNSYDLETHTLFIGPSSSEECVTGLAHYIRRQRVLDDGTPEPGGIDEEELYCTDIAAPTLLGWSSSQDNTINEIFPFYNPLPGGGGGGGFDLDIDQTVFGITSDFADYSYTNEPRPSIDRFPAPQYIQDCTLTIKSRAGQEDESTIVTITNSGGTIDAPVICPGTDGDGQNVNITHTCDPRTVPGDPYYSTIWVPGQPIEPVSTVSYTCDCPYFSQRFTDDDPVTAFGAQSEWINFNGFTNAPALFYQQRICKHIFAVMAQNGEINQDDIPQDLLDAESEFYTNLYDDVYSGFQWDELSGFQQIEGFTREELSETFDEWTLVDDPSQVWLDNDWGNAWSQQNWGKYWV